MAQASQAQGEAQTAAAPQSRKPAVEVDYDPSQTSYERLLTVFWATHNPCAANGSRQYMSALFYHNDAQKKLALGTQEREEARKGTRIATEVLPATTFYVAEDYHQNYYNENSRQPYCMFVISPKLAKFEKKFAEKMRA